MTLNYMKMSNWDESIQKNEEHQDTIRSELAHISFESLQKVREKLGTKIYNETVFGIKKYNKTDFKMDNKNLPHEVSSKRPASRFRQIIEINKNVPRDPRFDGFCGLFNEKAFKNSYSFLNELKKKDVQSLKEELKNTKDVETLKKIKYLIQRLENQIREEKNLRHRKEKVMKEKRRIIETLKQGRKPIYKKKSDRKVLNLVSQYEELKIAGRLKKHIHRLRKKKLSKAGLNMKVVKFENN